jgi:hypothetical protein
VSPVQDETLQIPSGLVIESYELRGPPELDTYIFQPVSGTQEEILETHAWDRAEGFPDISFFDAMNFGMRLPHDGQELIAQVVSGGDHQPDQNVFDPVFIEVVLGNQLLYRAEAGEVSPLNPLQGLWGYDGHWVLEYTHVSIIQGEAENSLDSKVTGHLVEDGVLLNEVFGYDEIFGSQLLKSRPFYFFKEGDQIGISYDGQVTLLDFEDIPHYGCCSAATINPRQAQNMVAFFAQREETWYYVEAGVYDWGLDLEDRSGCVITGVPEELGVDPFYEKYCDADGIPIISSATVDDLALQQAYYIIHNMLYPIPKVRQELVEVGAYFGIIGKDENQTTLPEYAHLDSEYWDWRARGLGAGDDVRITSAAEENLLCLRSDRYYGESIAVHEFAHTISLLGFGEDFEDLLLEFTHIYNSAIEQGLWGNTYAGSNIQEYWAEGVQTYFSTNLQSALPDGVHNKVNTREELADYDPALFEFVSRIFGNYEWTPTCPE